MIASKVWLVAAVAAAGIASSAASAQTTLKIGVINVARLIEQSPQSETVHEKPRGRVRSAATRPHGDADAAAHADRRQFQRDAPVMGEEERLNLERQIRDGQRD